jgi:hypothetical protein
MNRYGRLQLLAYESLPGEAMTSVTSLERQLPKAGAQKVKSELERHLSLYSHISMYY